MFPNSFPYRLCSVGLCDFLFCFHKGWLLKSVFTSNTRGWCLLRKVGTLILLPSEKMIVCTKRLTRFFVI